MRDLDVIVAGGGCAGLWAAFVAAGRGARTLVVEKEPRIGERVICAEGVGTEGIRRFIEIEDEWVAAPVHGGRFCSPDGNCVDADEPGCGFILNKDLFLRGLAERAEGAGARIRTGCKVVGMRSLDEGGFEVAVSDGGSGGQSGPAVETLSCGSLVAADGIQSGVARMAGIDTRLPPQDIFICVQNTVSCIDLRPNFVEFHFGRDIAPGGYAWVFPKGDDRANVGLGITCSGAGARARDYLERFMAVRCPEARVEKTIAGGVPSVGKAPKAYHKGLFLAGDAARAADPVSGAGIVPAMESAAVSGEFAAVLALGEATPAEIEREFARRYGEVLRWRRLRYGLKKVFTKLTDGEFSKVVSLIGEYSESGGSLQAPGRLVRFFMKSMPRSFGMLRHLVGV